MLLPYRSDQWFSAQLSLHKLSLMSFRQLNTVSSEVLGNNLHKLYVRYSWKYIRAKYECMCLRHTSFMLIACRILYDNY